MKITSALITAAGFGSRFFPLTKSVQKEMLPVLNHPILDYLVDDCIAAGIENIYLVVREDDRLVQPYYTEQPQILEQLKRIGAEKKYAALENLHSKANFTFIVQKPEDGYGTAVPVKLAEPYLKDQPGFLYLTGDDFILNDGEGSEAGRLITTWETAGCPQAVLSAQQVPNEMTHRYGILEVNKSEQATWLTGFVEKPPQGSAPSNLANISKYVFTPAIFEALRGQQVNPQAQELYITDTVLSLSQSGQVAVHVPTGQYLDCGSVLSWLKTNLTLALRDPEISDDVRTMMQSML